MIDWDYYSKRRNVNLVNFIIKNDVENYDQLVEILNDKGVNAPPKGMFQSAYAIAVPPIESANTQPAPKAENKPELNLRPATKRKKQSSKRTASSKKG